MAGQSVRDIRRRITSVKNTQQITKAMEMVSAAKLRRSQNQVMAGRPFAAKLREVLSRLNQARSGREEESGPIHPLLEVREVKRVLYVFITADRGLAGGYNANLIRFFHPILTSTPHDSEVIVMGRKGRDFLVKNGIQPLKEYVQIGDEIEYLQAQTIARELMDAFTRGEFDEINMVYSQFVSPVTQRPSILRLLPLDEAMDEASVEKQRETAAEEAEGQGADDPTEGVDYIYEPNPEAVLNMLLPRYVETEVYRIMVEAKTSEHGARMTAMRNASDNAEEMIDMLTLTYNRARQAGITKEISEIVGGAEAISAH